MPETPVDTVELAKRLRTRAYRMLARREYSATELSSRLSTDGAPFTVVRALIADLVRDGHLSDTRFAESASRQKQGRYSTRYIASAIAGRGVSGEVAREAVGALGQDDRAVARALWQRQFGHPPQNEREKAKQIRFLLARGFPASLAFAILREAGARVDDDNPGSG